MEFTEGEIIQKVGEECMHCAWNPLLPYEYEFTCFSCGYDVIKRKKEFSKFSRQEIIFINRLKYAEKKQCVIVKTFI